MQLRTCIDECVRIPAGGLPTAYVYGGPVAAVYGWVAASLANILVGLSMAEIASSYPVAGGPYFW